MKHHRFTLLLIVLLAAGCAPWKKLTNPDSPPKTTAAKPADPPPAVSKLLPLEQVNETNAKDQARQLEAVLKQENAPMGMAQRN